MFRFAQDDKGKGFASFTKILHSSFFISKDSSFFIFSSSFNKGFFSRQEAEELQGKPNAAASALRTEAACH